MKIAFPLKIAGLFALLNVKLFSAEPLVSFSADQAALSSSYLEIAPDVSNTTLRQWNFQESTPLVATVTPIYGGVSISNNGNALGSSMLRLHDNSPIGWPNKPSLFAYSTAGGNGATENTVDMFFLWKRSAFLDTIGGSIAFDSDASLSVRITDWASTAAVPGQIRFVILNGGSYYISEAVRSSAGTLTLTDFSNNSTAGKRWASFQPTSTEFAIPSGLSFGAVTFDDVRAVGWIGRGARQWSAPFAFDQFSATGSSLPLSMQISTNLSSLNDYTYSQVFLDIKKSSRGWNTRNADYVGGSNPWNTDLASFIEKDRNGWPTRVPFDQPYGNGVVHPKYSNDANFKISTRQIVHTIMGSTIGGSYRLRFKGTGTFTLKHQAGVNQRIENFSRARIDTLPTDIDGYRYFDTQPLTLTTASNGGLVTNVYLELYETTSPDYLRDFQFITPGYTSAQEASEIFNPAFVAHCSAYGTLRFMDWGSTNGNSLENWSQRTLPTSHTQSGGLGASLEFMVALSNAAGTNFWLCIPAKADDTYITKAARLILNGAKADGEPFDPAVDPLSARVWPGLDPDLKLLIEYSNETWNGLFSQTAYATSQGVALRNVGLPFNSTDWVAGSEYTSYRSAQIWQLFSNEFGAAAPDRIVRVISSQNVSSVSRYRLEAFTKPGLVTNGQYPDALAIAPYFGGSVGDKIVADNVLATITVPEIVARAQLAIDGLGSSLASHRTLADEFGVYLTTYESGQHLVGTQGNIGNTTLTSKLVQTNRDPGMGTLYTNYLNLLNSYGITELTHFNDIGGFSNFGSWGAQEYFGQPLELTPKRAALLDFMADYPANNQPPLLAVSVPQNLVDTDGNGTQVLTFSAEDSRDYDGRIASVEWVANGKLLVGTTAIFTLPVGEHSVSVAVSDNEGAVTRHILPVTVRPKGSDTTILVSNFGGTLSPGQNSPWLSTSTLDNGITQSGWTYGIRPNNTGYGITGGTAALNAFTVSLTASSTARTTLEEAIATNQYFKLSITPKAGYSLDLRGGKINFTVRNSDSNSANRAAVMTSIAGFNSGDQLFTTPLFKSGDNVFTLQLPGTVMYANVTQPLEIRVYLYGNIYASKPVGLSAFSIQSAIR